MPKCDIDFSAMRLHSLSFQHNFVAAVRFSLNCCLSFFWIIQPIFRCSVNGWLRISTFHFCSSHILLSRLDQWFTWCYKCNPIFIFRSIIILIIYFMSLTCPRQMVLFIFFGSDLALGVWTLNALMSRELSQSQPATLISRAEQCVNLPKEFPSLCLVFWCEDEEE